MPRKTIAFQADPEKVLEDFFDLYVDSTALVVALKRRLVDVGQDTAWVTDRMRQLDNRVLRILKDARGAPSTRTDAAFAELDKLMAGRAPLSDRTPPPPSQP